MLVSLLSIQVAIKQISSDRVQQWARLVSDGYFQILRYLQLNVKQSREQF